MSITNPDAKTRLFGFSIPNMLLYGLILVAVFIAVKIAFVFVNLFKKIKTMLGFGTDDSTSENQEYINNTLEKDPAVKSQVNVGTGMIADQIYNAVNGFLISDGELKDAFSKITGPNHMKAVYLAYGTRTVTIIPFYNFTGNLVAMMKWRMLSYQLNSVVGKIGNPGVNWSINTKLNWIK